MISIDTKIITVYNGAQKICNILNAKNTLIFSWEPRTRLPSIDLLKCFSEVETKSAIEVYFNSGLRVCCDLEQEFYTFRGEKIKAKDIAPNMSIRAFSMDLHKDGHYRVHGFINGKAKHQYVARMIWEFYNGKITDNRMVLHHKDVNKVNNDIDNLMLLDRSIHASFHNSTTHWNKRYSNHKVLLIKDLGEKILVSPNVKSFVVADDPPIAGNASGIILGGINID